MMVFLGNETKPGSGAVKFQAPTKPPSDAAAALSGYVPPIVPPLRTVARPQNQPLQPFTHGQADESHALLQTSFRPTNPAPSTNLSERMAFDWRQAQVRQEKGHWKLTVGSHVLGDFGENRNAASQALKAVQYYHFTEHCTVGQPTPSCSYFLVNGQAPRGIAWGLDIQPLNLEHLAVQPVGNRFALMSGDKAVLRFGEHPEEAQHMLNVIQRHKFDHVCYVGGPEEPAMTILLKAR
jgi:hypothetical protein